MENTKHQQLPTDDRVAIEMQAPIEVGAVDVNAKWGVESSKNPVQLEWNDLVVTSKNSKAKAQKQLLNNISGSISGGLWAIMGPSGSGKTTFLSSLALRIDTYRMNVSGTITMNGKPYTKQELKAMSGYVMQDDLLDANFTVEETLHYTALLRMPSTTTAAERKEREDYLLDLMGIGHCRNTLVGDTRRKGISGGERKRLCIAMELLTKPALLFLDEPTSGLDSSTALSVMKTLKDLATKGECTVVTTIHQPQSKIYALIDNLMLMSEGNILYQGPSASAIAHFTKLGYPLPPETNPADHLIDILTQTTDVKGESLDSIKEAMVVPLSPDYGATASTPSMKAMLPWVNQFLVLFRRALHGHMRRWDIIATNVFVTALIATFVGTNVWRDIGNHKAGSSRRYPALFYCVIHQGVVASLQGTHSFPLERALMLRERAAGAYYVSAYFLSKTFADFLAQIVGPIIYTVMAYPLIGFYPHAKQFFIFLGFMILDSAAATSLATCISCLCVSISMSTVVMACVYETVRLFGGWFISPSQIAFYPRWRFLDALSYIKYAFVGVSLNEQNYVITCLPGERSPPNAPGPQTAANCKIPPLTTYPYTGVAFSEYYGYSNYTIKFCAGMLVVYIVVCRLLAYLGLRFIKV